MPFLESYGAADGDEASLELAQRIIDTLIKEKILLLEKIIKKPGPVRRARMSEAAMEVAVNDWGLNVLPNQNRANVHVDSISDAIGSKRAALKMQKREEKEKRREEAQFEREVLNPGLLSNSRVN